MSVTSELRCRVRAERSLSRYEPCLPSPAKHPPAGSGWIHEIKHDGFRIIAEREVDRVRLMTRNGHDFSGRFPLIVATIGALPAQSCVLDGEAIACDERGLSVFDMIRWRQHDNAVTLCAFDLLELDGEDCDASQSRFARLRSRGYCAAPAQASRSTAISRSMARLSTNKPAHLAARASCRSVLGRHTDEAVAIVGSRSKTLPRRRCVAPVRCGLANCLCCSSRKNNNLCPNRRTAIKIDHVIIGQPDAA